MAPFSTLLWVLTALPKHLNFWPLRPDGLLPQKFLINQYSCIKARQNARLNNLQKVQYSKILLIQWHNGTELTKTETG